MSKILVKWQRGSAQFRAVVSEDQVSAVEVHATDNLGAPCWKHADKPGMCDAELLRRALFVAIESERKNPSVHPNVPGGLHTLDLGVLK